MANIILNLFDNASKAIILITILIISLRLIYLISVKQKIILYKELLFIVFVLYIVCLYYVVTFKDNNYGTNNLIPFNEIFRYDFGSKLFIKNIIGNILLFVPFGIFITGYTKNRYLFKTLAFSIIGSCLIEYVQHIIGRTSDVDDIILNVLGGVVGYFICKIIMYIYTKLPKIMQNDKFLNILSLTVILVIIYIVIKFEFWRLII